MKKLMLITLIGLIFLLSGCSVNYKLNITEDLIFEEEISVLELTNVLSLFSEDVEEFIFSSVEFYSSNEEYNNYYIYDSSDTKVTSISGQATYLSFDDYKNRNLLKDDFFSDCSFIINDEIVELKFFGNESNNLFIGNELGGTIIDSASINITVPFKVISSNAERVDKETNTYTWIYDKNNYEKDITMEFDMSDNHTKEATYVIYIIGGIIVWLIVIGIYIYYRYKKNSF